MPDATIPYWLPTTRVRLTRTFVSAWAVDWAAHKIHRLQIPAADISFYAAADTTSPRGRKALLLDAGALKAANVALQFHPDGRIASFSSTQDAQLDTIIGNAARVAGLVAVTGLALANPALGLAAAAAAAAGAATATASGEESAEGAVRELIDGSTEDQTKSRVTDPAEELFSDWRATHAAAAARGEELHATLTAIDAALAGRLAGLAGVPAPVESRQATNARAKGSSRGGPASNAATTADDVKVWTDLRTARDELAKDLEAIEESAKAWAEQSQVGLASRVMTAQIGALPLVDRLEPVVVDWAEFCPPGVTVWPDEADLRLVRVDPPLSEAGAMDRDDHSDLNDIKVRLARPVAVGVYTLSSLEAEWVLTNTLEVAVVDDSSRVTHVPFLTGKQADRTVTITTGADGVTSSIGVIQASSAAEISAAARAGGEGLVAGVTSAKGMLADFSAAQTSAGSIRTAGLTRSIAELELAKRKLDAELALSSAVSSRSLVEQKQQLEAQVEVLKQVLALGTTARAIVNGPAPASGAAAAE